MNEAVWLLVEIVETKDEWTKVKSELFDGTNFEIVVRDHDLTRIEKDSSVKRAWLMVESHGIHGDRVSIELPRPVLDKGHRVSVDMKRINKSIAPSAVVAKDHQESHVPTPRTLYNN